MKNILINYIRPTEIQADNERSAFLFLFILTFTQIVAFQAWQMLNTNFFVDVIGLDGSQMGIIQSIRELPGLLAVSVLFLLIFMSEISVAIFAVAILGIGVMLTGMLPSYAGVIFTTLVLSTGFHYYETVNQSLTLQAFNQRVSPLVFGRLRSISALGNILAAIFILLCLPFMSYVQLYAICGMIAVVGAIWAYKKRPNLTHLPMQRKRIILKKKYWLFYVLTLLAGGRRQIFMVFSLILLVEHFGYSAAAITTLFLINNAINWAINPIIGRLINKYGEQSLLTSTFIPTVLIFLAYAFIDNAFIIAVLYIVDQFLFNFNIAEKTFFQKISEPEDIAPSMATGFTINHIVAVIVPAVCGFLWMIDYRIPFIVGAVIALVALIFVQFINIEIKKADERLQQ